MIDGVVGGEVLSLWDLMDHWIQHKLPSHIQEEVNIYFNSEVKSLSLARLFATLWIVAYQALPSMGYSRQEYWSGLPFPSPGDLPNPGIEPGSPALKADTLTSEPPGKQFILMCVCVCVCVCVLVA